MSRCLNLHHLLLSLTLLPAWLAGTADAQTQTEACCLASGSCIDMTPFDCQANGGIPGGPGTSCIDNPNICTERPCCLPGGQCVPGISPQHCQQQGGTPLPLGSTCPPNLLCSTDSCVPTPDKKACRDTQCPITGEKCKPQKLRFYPWTGTYLVEACDCTGADQCHIELGTAGPQCVGTCPDGTACHQVSVLNADGTIDYGCRCDPVPQECQPTADKKGCQQTHCDNPDEQCIPRCVKFNPATGQIEVAACDCRSPEECHVKPVPGALPECEGNCPPGTTCVRKQKTFADGTIGICCDCEPQPPQECKPKPDGSACEDVCPAGTTGVCKPSAVHITPNGQTIVTKCDCKDTDVCHVEVIPGAFPACQGGCPTGQTCEQRLVTHADGSIDVYCDCKPCLQDPDCDDGDPCTQDLCDPATGACTHTPVNCDDGNPCTIDTCAPSTTGVGYVCVHTPVNCDDGDKCTVDSCVPTATGGIACVHVPVNCDDGDPCTDDRCDPATGLCSHVPNDKCCGPVPDGSACRQVDCPIPGEECRPSKVQYDPATGQFRILECECRGQEECHLVPPPTPGALPDCTGSCPTSGQQCEQVISTIPGTNIVTISCDCKPCLTDAHCDDGNPCTADHCDPATGGCIHIPINCDDGDKCTIDECDPASGGCVHIPVNCDDGNPCTEDRCDPQTGACVHIAIVCDDNNPCTQDFCVNGICQHVNICEACCLPNGSCVNVPPSHCQGTPQGPGSNCATTTCPKPTYPKFSQPPQPPQGPGWSREDIASNLDINDFAPRVVVADDFQSDGRPIVAVRWWGSYINPEFKPAKFGGFGQPPFMIDGWLISFHLPLRVIPNQAPACNILGLYFAPADKVRIVAAPMPYCDGHEVYEYLVNLSDCCLLQANIDPRSNFTPATSDAFREQRCFWYDLDVQALVGRRYERDTATGQCVFPVSTLNRADGDFWGWHMTNYERGKRRAVRAPVSPSGPGAPQLCYGPWAYFPGVCPQPPIAAKKRMNMAFELLTDNPQLPPPCPKVVDWHIFYKGSAFGTTPAPDKFALLSGYPADFQNVSTYSRGLNGVHLDIQDLPGMPGPADFACTMGNSHDVPAWVPAPAPTSVSVLAGGGVGGSHRVTLSWPDNAVPNRNWLRIAVLATAETGLTMEEEVYFGLLPGETGAANSGAAFAVTSNDYNDTYNNRTPPLPLTQPITNVYDFNHDRVVTSSDYNLSYNERGSLLDPAKRLLIITPP